MGGLVRGAGAGRGVIDKDFAFRGNKAGNSRRNFRDHGAARGAAGTNRTERAGSSPGVEGPGVLAAARSFIRAGGPDTLAVFAVRPARGDIGGHGGRPSGR
jgi:hypothetical protein